MYMPTDSTSIYVMDSCDERLKEDAAIIIMLTFRVKGKRVFAGNLVTENESTRVRLVFENESTRVRPI